VGDLLRDTALGRGSSSELSFHACRVSLSVRRRKPSSPVVRAEASPSAVRSSETLSASRTATVGPPWLHEIEPDGYRMAARINNGQVQVFTRTGLDWRGKYPSAIAALANLDMKTAYLDGELCDVDDAGLPSFAHTQTATNGELD
jgi:bifunctional non-homologous end joining protein LigD